MRVRPLARNVRSAALAVIRSRVPAVAGVLLAVTVAGWPGVASAQSLRGGKGAMAEQYRQAQIHDFTKLRDPSHVHRFVELGLLVPLKGNRDYRLHDVSFPYAREEVRLFVERLARQYRLACGEQLVVTSLTRPVSHQPGNSSEDSVHPMGMAVDLRYSTTRACRVWLENEVLLPLERQGALQATLEFRPVHYHIAVYPRQYAQYVAQLESRQADVAEATAQGESGASHAPPTHHTVRSGDSLWGIARSYGTTVDKLKAANNLRSSRIYAGQRLQLPVGA